MVFEFDHLFICTDSAAGAADQLKSCGFREGSPSIHPGQGTANRRFFFDNAMLELLWVHDPQEAQSQSIHLTRLWERWINRKNGVCPFGICVRSTPSFRSDLAFPSWSYQPPYLSETMTIHVANNSEVLTEPMLFQISFGGRPDRYPMVKAQPLDHRVGVREITRLTLVSPASQELSPEFQAVLQIPPIQHRVGTEYCVELGFDGEVHSQRLDCRPELPLLLQW